MGVTSLTDEASSPSSGFTDIHAHFLPGVDDGPATLDMALDAVRTAVEGGTSVAFATPHVNSRMPLSTERRALIAQRYELLLEAIDGEGLPLELRLGYEVTPTRELLAVDPHLLRLADLPTVRSSVGATRSAPSLNMSPRRVCSPFWLIPNATT
jgi:hypothetical protein